MFSLVLAGSLVSCGGASHDASSSGDVLLLVGDSALMMDDVVRKIPTGLSEADSVAMFNSIVDRWLESLLLIDVAKENLPDMSRIDRMVEDYRNTLIIQEYMRMMTDDMRREVKAGDVRKYYEAFGDSMLLEHPLVKGIYIKLPDDSPALDEVRSLIADASPQSIDRIEKQCLKGAMQYDYFADRWIDFSTLAEHIPYRIDDPDLFVREHINFELNRGGSVYLLHISDYLPSGAQMPAEYAEAGIREILGRHRDRENERKLVNSIFKNALKQGKLKAVSFNPLTHKYIIKDNKTTET